MGRVPDDVVVGVLAALGDDASGLQRTVLPQPEIGGDVARVPDFLERQHVGPERIDEALLPFLQHPAQFEARVEQQFLTLGLRTSLVGFGIVVVAEHVARHGLDIEAGTPVHIRHPFRDLPESLLVHIGPDRLRAARRTGQRQQGLVLVVFKDAVQVLHDHRIARVVMPFLLGKHQIQRFRRLDRHLALDCSNSAHSFLHP